MKFYLIALSLFISSIAVASECGVFVLKDRYWPEYNGPIDIYSNSAYEGKGYVRTYEPDDAFYILDFEAWQDDSRKISKAVVKADFILTDLTKIEVEESVSCFTDICTNTAFTKAFSKAFKKLNKLIPKCR